jgi:hypothetical protein
MCEARRYQSLIGLWLTGSASRLGSWLVSGS